MEIKTPDSSVIGLSFGHLPELLCLRPGFDLTVAVRQGISFAGLNYGRLPGLLLSEQPGDDPECRTLQFAETVSILERRVNMDNSAK